MIRRASKIIVAQPGVRPTRALAACPRIDASDLARRSFLPAPSLTRILQECERRRIVSRTAHGSDQRRALFALTAARKRSFATVAPDSERLYESISAQFGKRKLVTLCTC